MFDRFRDESAREPQSTPEDGARTSCLGEMRRINGVPLDRIRNAVEVLACRMFERKLERIPEICRCQQCVEDMYCLALNHVQPLYYHSTSSFALRLEDQGPPTDIIDTIDRAIDHAIIRVGENPSHR